MCGRERGETWIGGGGGGGLSYLSLFACVRTCMLNVFFRVKEKIKHLEHVRESDKEECANN